MTTTLYVEGGGDGRSLRARFREGWSGFFESAGLHGRVKIVRGGGREQTFDRFVAAVTSGGVGASVLLLVDSEGPVAPGATAWEHLHARDGWTRPDAAGDDQVFLMVQVMETWFLADRDALRRYFGAEFRENAIGRWQVLEDVPKATVLKALERATAACRKSYAKGKVSFELLARVDPDRVEAACRHARALLDRLRAQLKRIELWD